MTPENEATIQQALDLLKPWAQEADEHAPDRLYVVIEASDLPDATAAILDWGYLATITGVDLGVEAGQIEALYHFCAGANVATLRVRTPRENPVLPSLYGLIPSVTFYEREMIEMFGITIEGTPNTERLFLPDDWPEGVYPLRKDFSMDDLKG